MARALPAAGQGAPRPGAGFRVVPMDLASLDEVVAIEVAAYAFPWSRGNFIDSLAAGYVAMCLIDEATARTVGYFLAMHGVQETHLLNLTVSPAAQGQGHARRMLAELVRLAAEQGAEALWLEVRPSNERALALYQRLGFRRAGLRRGYYPAAEGRREDAIVMRLALATLAQDGQALDRPDPPDPRRGDA